MSLDLFANDFPNPEAFAHLQPEELGFRILEAITPLKGENYNPLLRSGADFWNSLASYYENFKGIKPRRDLNIYFCEAWNWLITQNLIAQSYDMNQIYFVTRKGKKYADRALRERFRMENYLSLDIIHPRLRETVYSDFINGDFDAAVFKAYKKVEVTARERGNIPKSVIGKDVLIQFLSPNRLPTLPESFDQKDRGHLINLFTSLYALYRNPTGHEDVEISPQSAIHLIMQASHLLRTIDALTGEHVDNKT